MGFFWPCPSPAQEPATNFTAEAPPSVADATRDLLSKSSEHLADGDLDQAVREASLAIQLDPHNSQATYEMRGSIYIQGKLWDKAERDYTTADRISPDIAYKYKLAEIKFLQKAYDDARPRFAAFAGRCASRRSGHVQGFSLRPVWRARRCFSLGSRRARSSGRKIHPTITAMAHGICTIVRGRRR